MPKRPNADIRESLFDLALDIELEALKLREMMKQADKWILDRTGYIIACVDSLRDHSMDLHNDKPKQRAKPVSNKITRRVVLSVKQMRQQGFAVSIIASSHKINVARVNEIQRGLHDHLLRKSDTAWKAKENAN
jgi:hypothetical protein